MNGRHPIDDLFARGLRDAEATPPQAVWEGVVRKRGWGHLTWLRLRKHWRLSILALFLLGGTAAYWAATPAGSAAVDTSTPARTEETSLSAVVDADTQTPTATRTISHEQVAAVTTTAVAERSSSGRVEPAPTNSKTATTADGKHTTTATGSDPAVARNRDTDAGHEARGPLPNASIPATVADQAKGRTSVSSDPGADPFAPEIRSAASSTASGSLLPSMAPASAPAFVFDPSFTRPLDPLDIRASRSSMRFPKLERPVGEGLPTSRAATPYVLPNADWWVAVQAGYYNESRMWHGTDEHLVNGLNSTEKPHAPWGIGVLAGREYRSGWGFSSGAEYVSAQYDFKHEDRIIERNETITSVMVTLNAEVLDTYLDTIVTIEEERRQVEAINRYSIIRVPLEGSYHKGCGRWTYGVRAGLAAEFLTMRSGLTLADEGEEGSAYSVELDQSSGRTRTATLLSAGVGLDLGYSLTEHLGLWLTPTYSRGISPLGDHDLYALPERTGLRLRLSYTLPLR